MAQTHTHQVEQATTAVLVEAVIVLAVGVALAFVDLLSSADAQLRVPALIASLALVGDSINKLRPVAPRTDTYVVVDPAGESSHEVPVEQPPQASQLVPVLLLVLAIWLGIMTLMHQDAELQLSVLSLIASFFIISRGLRDLPG
jgi:hypothetical protein